MNAKTSDLEYWSVFLQYGCMDRKGNNIEKNVDLHDRIMLIKYF